ncbi:MAG: zinc-dependent peptidase [Azoarcus sp.]|jgi:Mlc titration factor MtfA (ptsG expression regulator)|nr:zinc-dependent peptidase [Azoarcus sp.]
MFDTLKRWLNRARRSEIATPTPELWARVEARLPFLDFLPEEARLRLRALAVAFLGEKEFYGARGLRINDDIMLSIALQACLLILKRGLAAYRGWVGIIVYPGDFVVPRQVMDEAGIVHEYNDQLLGEARRDGPVIVAWFDGGSPGPGVNVIVHEFAHKLDMANGNADGFPRLLPGMSRRQWADVFTTAYGRLCRLDDSGIETILDPYAASNPGEFFAVASEAFFETPLSLRAEFPAVYAQLSAYYGLDTAEGEAQASGFRFATGFGMGRNTSENSNGGGDRMKP